MCVAMPGKVTKVKEKYATVDVDGNNVDARSGLVELKEGDYVLVHAGYIIQKLSEKDALEMKELMELMNG
jgi:hydrogenase expression/formation protein HypC